MDRLSGEHGSDQSPQANWPSRKLTNKSGQIVGCLRSLASSPSNQSLGGFKPICRRLAVVGRSLAGAEVRPFAAHAPIVDQANLHRQGHESRIAPEFRKVRPEQKRAVGVTVALQISLR